MEPSGRAVVRRAQSKAHQTQSKQSVNAGYTADRGAHLPRPGPTWRDGCSVRQGWRAEGRGPTALSALRTWRPWGLRGTMSAGPVRKRSVVCAPRPSVHSQVTQKVPKRVARPIPGTRRAAPRGTPAAGWASPPRAAPARRPT